MPKQVACVFSCLLFFLHHFCVILKKDSIQKHSSSLGAVGRVGSFEEMGKGCWGGVIFFGGGHCELLLRELLDLQLDLLLQMLLTWDSSLKIFLKLSRTAVYYKTHESSQGLADSCLDLWLRFSDFSTFLLTLAETFRIIETTLSLCISISVSVH